MAKDVSKVIVSIRVKPEQEHQFSRGLVINPNQNTIDLNYIGAQYEFQFDRILPMHCSQQDVFTACCGSIVIDSVLNGFNSTILTYGQTGK